MYSRLFAIPQNKKDEGQYDERDCEQAEEGSETTKIIALLAHTPKLLRVVDYSSKTRYELCIVVSDIIRMVREG